MIIMFGKPPGWRPPPRDEYPKGIPVDVCVLFEKLTWDLVNAGWPHYSARAILHQIRWHHHVDIGDRTFKANNNWTPALARWVMNKHPSLAGFFRIRASPTVGSMNSDHSMEDYMGPFTGDEA